MRTRDIGPTNAGGYFVRTVTQRTWFVHLAAGALFLAATMASFAAQHADRPRSAAVIYVLGVTLVGAVEGFWGGLIAALIASGIYNFFLSDPVFRFSLTSVDEMVPLVAFNISAAASGLLTGWLKDRASAAENATRRMRGLLAVSEDLQHANRLSDIPAVVRTFLGSDGVHFEMFVQQGERLIPLQVNALRAALAKRVHDQGLDQLQDEGFRAFLLSTPARRSGVLVLPIVGERQRDAGEEDLEAFVRLLSIALERCLLLDELAEAAALRRSEELKSALLSSVSHDMRTPLSAISASASSLRSFGEELPSATRADLLAAIEEQCERLNRYTTNLLNMGRVQGGIDPARLVECDVVEVLGSAIARIRQSAGGRDLLKDYALTSAVLQAEPVMLEQSVYNVLENALHYSPPTKPVLIRLTEEGGFILISIEDEGPGIAEEERERVFDRFYRARSAQGREGSGLGLSIAKGFVEALGGSIEASARSGGTGTAIRIRLPASSSKVSECPAS